MKVRKKIISNPSGSGVGSGAAAILQQPITVAGNSVNSATVGTTFAAGTLIEDVVRSMLTLAIPFNYTQPSVSISSNITGLREVGVSISPTITATYNGGNANAPLQEIWITRNGVEISPLPRATTSPFVYVDSNFIVPLGPTNWKAQAAHGDANLMNDNLGNPSPSGRPMAGTKTSGNVTVTGVYPFLFGMNANPSLSGTDFYNAFAATRLIQNQGNKTVLLNGNTQYIYFAFPATYSNLVSIIDQNGFNVTSAFQMSILSVTSSGLAANWTINYKVYRTIETTTVNSANFQFRFS